MGAEPDPWPEIAEEIRKLPRELRTAYVTGLQVRMQRQLEQSRGALPVGEGRTAGSPPKDP